MNTKHWLQLLTLAAIWGSSYLLMRIVAPALGPIATACARVAIAGPVLLIFLALTRRRFQWKENWKHFFIIGALNAGLPFLFFSFAALHIPASLSAIFNSTAPLFGSIFAAIWLSEKLTIQKTIGLLFGVAGVSFIAIRGPLQLSTESGFLPILACLACLAAAMCYSLAAVYIKKFTSKLDPIALSGASLTAAALLLAPLVPFSPPAGVISNQVIFCLLILALVCSSIAYVLYFKLTAALGPSRTLTVTFLIPLFGIFWGYVLLGEAITTQMLIGCALILSGTGLVLFRPRGFSKPSYLKSFRVLYHR